MHRTRGRAYERRCAANQHAGLVTTGGNLKQGSVGLWETDEEVAATCGSRRVVGMWSLFIICYLALQVGPLSCCFCGTL